MTQPTIVGNQFGVGDDLPIGSPIAEYVNRKLAEFANDEYQEMNRTGILINLSDHKARFRQIRQEAIAKWLSGDLS